MTEEDKRLLGAFEGKLQFLIYRFNRQKEEIASLRRLLSEKEETISILETNVKELESKYAYLRTARIISISDNDMRDTKKRLAKLVREVDKCIALLNE